MRGFVDALIVTVSALVGGASAVRAADTTCTSTLTGTIDGNVVVPDGASCTLSDATVAGNVQVLQNGSLTVDATQQPTTIDGVKAFFSDGWVLVRPSGTEPICRIFAESQNPQRASDLLAWAVELVRGVVERKTAEAAVSRLHT